MEENPNTIHDRDLALSLAQEEQEEETQDDQLEPPFRPETGHQRNILELDELSIGRISEMLGAMDISATIRWQNINRPTRNEATENRNMAALYYQVTYDRYEMENQRLEESNIITRSHQEINFEILRRIFRSPNARGVNNQLLPVFTQVIEDIMTIDPNAINYVDNFDNTILHMAAREHLESAVRAIVNHANYLPVTFQNRAPSGIESMTPAALAGDHTNIVELINTANGNLETERKARPINPQPNSNEAPANQKRLYNSAARRRALLPGNQGGAYAHGHGPAAGGVPSNTFTIAGAEAFFAQHFTANTQPALPPSEQDDDHQITQETPGTTITEAAPDTIPGSPSNSRQNSP